MYSYLKIKVDKYLTLSMYLHSTIKHRPLFFTYISTILSSFWMFNNKKVFNGCFLFPDSLFSFDVLTFWRFNRIDFSFSWTLKYLLNFCHFHISLYQTYVIFVSKQGGFFLFLTKSSFNTLSLVCAFENNLK